MMGTGWEVNTHPTPSIIAGHLGEVNSWSGSQNIQVKRECSPDVPGGKSRQSGREAARPPAKQLPGQCINQSAKAGALEAALYQNIPSVLGI